MSSLFSVVSLFSGCGGSSLGYQLAGGKVRLAVEWDDNAVETYKLNFPDTPIFHGDIKELSVEECCNLANIKPGELDILDGSPPCQGFSTAGRRQLTDARNYLFQEYARLLTGLQPKVFVMENVSGMVKGKMKLIFAEILQELKGCGYKVKAKLLNAKYYNVPQSRQRIIFIGIRNDLQGEISFPCPNNNIIPVRDVLYDCPEGERQPDFSEKRLFANKIKPYKDGSDIIKGTFFNLKRLSWGKPSRSVIKMVGKHNSKFGGGLIHPKYNRHLTIPELKRIMTFPDDYKFVGKFEQQWGRIGNSVPPLFMKTIAEHIRDKLLKREVA